MRKHATLKETETHFTSRFRPRGKAKGRNDNLENFKYVSKMNFGKCSRNFIHRRRCYIFQIKFLFLFETAK
jgi:hypothetical protein